MKTYLSIILIIVLISCQQNKKKSFYKDVVEPTKDTRTELYKTVLEDKSLYQNISPRNINNVDKFSGFRNSKINSNILDNQINITNYYNPTHFDNYKSFTYYFNNDNNLANGKITDVRFEYLDNKLKFIKINYQELINKKDYVESHLNPTRTELDFEDYDELSIVELYSTVFGEPIIKYVDGVYGYDLYDYLKYPVCYNSWQKCIQDFGKGEKDYGILLRWKGSKISYDLFFKEQYGGITALLDDGKNFKIKAELYVYDNNSVLNKSIDKLRIKAKRLKSGELQDDQDKEIIKGL